jgi:hypothetical protein
VLFSNPDGTEEGTLTPDGGSPTTVRCRHEYHDPTILAGLSSPGHCIRVYADDGAIAKPEEGDVIVLTSGTYTVRAVREGPQRLSWVCDVDEVTA